MYKRQTLCNLPFRIAREEQLAVENAVQTGHMDIFHLIFVTDRLGSYLLKIPEYAISGQQLLIIQRLCTDRQSLTGYEQLEQFSRDSQYHTSYDSITGIFVGIILILQIEFSR
jgi:hypothetical protein